MRNFKQKKAKKTQNKAFVICTKKLKARVWYRRIEKKIMQIHLNA